MKYAFCPANGKLFILDLIQNVWIFFNNSAIYPTFRPGGRPKKIGSKTFVRLYKEQCVWKIRSTDKCGKKSTKMQQRFVVWWIKALNKFENKKIAFHTKLPLGQVVNPSMQWFCPNNFAGRQGPGFFLRLPGGFPHPAQCGATLPQVIGEGGGTPKLTI